MFKRLVEVALPLKEVSEQSAREKSIRHGHISTLHIWWARRPLAVCRAIVFASLIPDPDDPECPLHFSKLVTDVLKHNDFQPRNGDGSTLEDTPRNRCLELIKRLVRWENSTNPKFVDPARTLIGAAHAFMHSEAAEGMPKVLDPFTGGGSIPLEALRLGCEAHGLDLNPVAHLIELCTLVYPQKYGKPNCRPVPNYINRLVTRNETRTDFKKGTDLFHDGDSGTLEFDDEIVPDVVITEAEYRKNPLVADLKYWGHWIHCKATQDVHDLYPRDFDGRVPAAYLWARTVSCPNPSCKATIPLLRTLALTRNETLKVALKMSLDQIERHCRFQVVEGSKFDFDPVIGTMLHGSAQCPFCQTVVKGGDIRLESIAGRMGQQLIAVGSVTGTDGMRFRNASADDAAVYCRARERLDQMKRDDDPFIPNERITPDRPSPNSRGLSAAVRYGLDHFDKLFNDRQLVTMAAFVRAIRGAIDKVSENHDDKYAAALGHCIAMALGRLADYNSTFCVWGQGFIGHTFGRQALAMVWDYCEANPIGMSSGNWLGAFEWVYRVVENLSGSGNPAIIAQGSATRLPYQNVSFEAVLTDPPYYDSVPYGDLSDFFYVWLKRTVGDSFPELMRTPLTPKASELIAYFGSGTRSVQKSPEWYEQGMKNAFREICRVISDDGIVNVMFAHKTTSAWESIIAALHGAGVFVTSSWPIHTERAGRLVARNAAALASSVTLVCRKRPDGGSAGLWDDVRQDLKRVAQERLDFFWKQGIRGADFFISAIGPALSVFGKYDKVTKLSGEEVSVGQFLDEVRGLVTSYALAKILKTARTGTIDPESRFYVVWRWSYADAKVPADESFKLSQALGLDTETLWDKTGVLEKSGENVQATPIAKRIKLKNLGEPAADGASASVIDVLHRMCACREKGDTQGMAEFLGRSGHANNQSLWLIAQAVSEILPDGDKEKQLMQGLLNQKDQLDEAGRGRLF